MLFSEVVGRRGLKAPQGCCCGGCADCSAVLILAAGGVAGPQGRPRGRRRLALFTIAPAAGAGPRDREVAVPRDARMEGGERALVPVVQSGGEGGVTRRGRRGGEWVGSHPGLPLSHMPGLPCRLSPSPGSRGQADVPERGHGRRAVAQPPAQQPLSVIHRGGAARGPAPYQGPIHLREFKDLYSTCFLKLYSSDIHRLRLP